eukprot:10305582-Heterocapsa_arctica.AAC.1
MTDICAHWEEVVLKLGVNGLIGKLGEQKSPLHDGHSANSITGICRAAMASLCRIVVEQGAAVLDVDTDGLICTRINFENLVECFNATTFPGAEIELPIST